MTLRRLGLLVGRRLNLDDLMARLMVAMMEARQEDAALQVLDRAEEPNPTTRRFPREPTGDILP